ncbi:hypothetical protein [Mycobacterium sp. NPDC050853]|uniref:hypothetical protein n=1 Tax=Mycobacterium sp. NPDC050853 TaxID=3155160 RepID=UPI0033F986AB
MTTPLLASTPFLPDNEYLAAALHRIPDHARLVALRAKLIAHQISLIPPAAPSPPHEATDDIGGWLAEVNESAHARRLWQEQVDALAGQVQQCNMALSNFPHAHADTLFAALAHELNSVMAETADITDRLVDARTATEAIAAGAADSWQQLTPLRQAYDRIRDGQHTLMYRIGDPLLLGNAVSQYIPDELASDLVLANLDDVLPGWRGPQTGIIRVQGPPPERRPWPADPIEQLVWLATSAARPWVPTMQQLEELWADRRMRTDPTPAPTRIIRPLAREATAIFATD